MLNDLTRLTIATLLASSLSASAIAKPQIKDNAEIFHRLLTAAIGHEIRDKCPTIEARRIAATLYVLGIVSYASSQGFSRAEIDAYRKTKSEQDRLRAATYAYLEENGVDRDRPESYCTLGQAEMTKNSQIGKLLKYK